LNEEVGDGQSGGPAGRKGYPTTLALLPAVPVMAGIAHVGYLARWLMCIFLGGVVTAAMFLLMQLSIVLT